MVIRRIWFKNVNSVRKYYINCFNTWLISRCYKLVFIQVHVFIRLALSLVLPFGVYLMRVLKHSKQILKRNFRLYRNEPIFEFGDILGIDKTHGDIHHCRWIGYDFNNDSFRIEPNLIEFFNWTGVNRAVTIGNNSLKILFLFNYKLIEIFQVILLA